MSDFLRSFLGGGGGGVTSPRRGAGYITETAVKRKICTAKRSGDLLELSREEVSLLARMLERLENDPFDADPFLTKNDLSELGLTVVDKGTPLADKDGGSLGDVFGDSEDDATPNETEPIPVSAALTAPDNTPGATEPIPQEVLASMKVLQGDSSGGEDVADPAAIRAKLNGDGVSGKPAYFSSTNPPDVKQQSSKTLKDIFTPEEEDEVREVDSNEILSAFESKDGGELPAADVLGILRSARKEKGKDVLTEVSSNYRTKAFVESKEIKAEAKDKFSRALDALR